MERHCLQPADRDHTVGPDVTETVADAMRAGHGSGYGMTSIRRLPAVPVTLVAGLAVEPVVVVAATPVPVAAPSWIPPLTGTPVILREGRRLGFGDGGRPYASEP
jgi:hypothetical protein